MLGLGGIWAGGGPEGTCRTARPQGQSAPGEHSANRLATEGSALGRGITGWLPTLRWKLQLTVAAQ